MKQSSKTPSFRNPVAEVLQSAVLTNASNANPDMLDFQTEIDDRLLIVRGATKFLTDMFSNANCHGFDLDAEGLYGVTRLIESELAIVSDLHEGLQRVLKDGISQEARS